MRVNDQNFLISQRETDSSPILRVLEPHPQPGKVVHHLGSASISSVQSSISTKAIMTPEFQYLATSAYVQPVIMKSMSHLLGRFSCRADPLPRLFNIITSCRWYMPASIYRFLQHTRVIKLTGLFNYFHA